LSKPDLSGIKAYSVARWMKRMGNGGIMDHGQNRRHYTKGFRQRRNGPGEVLKWFNDRVKLDIAVIRCKGVVFTFVIYLVKMNFLFET